MFATMKLNFSVGQTSMSQRRADLSFAFDWKASKPGSAAGIDHQKNQDSAPCMASLASIGLLLAGRQAHIRPRQSRRGRPTS